MAAEDRPGGKGRRAPRRGLPAAARGTRAPERIQGMQAPESGQCCLLLALGNTHASMSHMITNQTEL